MTKTLLRHLVMAIFGYVLFFGLIVKIIDFIPVTLDMNAVSWSSTRGSITADVQGRKIRNCTVQPGTFVGWALRRGVWTEVPIDFPNDPSPDSSKPVGNFQIQSFGKWRWHTRPENGLLVKLTVEHSCDGKTRISTNGPFQYAIR